MIQKIMVCDDEEKEREEWREILQEYYGDDVKIVMCADGQEVEKAFSMEIFDLVLLNIEMPGKSGIEIKNRLRERGITCYIIFVADHREDALEAFEINVCGYLIKPLRESRDKLFQILKMIDGDEFQKKWIQMEETKGQIIGIQIKDIQYIKADRIHSVLMMRDRNISLRKSMSEWGEELRDEYFVRIHKSYIVNLRYVDKIAGQVYMKNGKVLSMTRDREKVDKIKKLYLEYRKKLHI